MFSVKEKRVCKGTGCKCFLHILAQPRTSDVNNTAAYGFSHLNCWCNLNSCHVEGRDVFFWPWNPGTSEGKLLYSSHLGV